MKKGLLITLKWALLIVPVIVFVTVEGSLFKNPSNVLGLSVIGMVALGIVGIGVLTEKKVGAFVWVLILGIALVAMSSISWTIGICFILEGAGLGINAMIINPMLKKIKIKELKDSGETVTYSTQI